MDSTVMKRKPDRNYRCSFLLLFLSLLFLLPVLYILLSSLMSPEEVLAVYTEGGEGFHIFPQKPSLMAYYQVFLATPEYLLKFWRSLGMSLLIAVPQLVIACLGGAAFAKYSFRGKRVIFFLFLLFMFLPIQATLVPDYYVLSKMGLIGSYWALILPNIFSPFAVVLLSLIFKNVPTEFLEAAKLDGAGPLRGLWNVLVPCGKPGIVSVFVLGFVDSWNMVEQPMVFLESVQEFPLAVFLASVNEQNLSLQFACASLCLLPVTLLFLFFQEELSQGVVPALSK